MPEGHNPTFRRIHSKTAISLWEFYFKRWVMKHHFARSDQFWRGVTNAGL